MSYRITVFGTGYLGATQAASLAGLGFEVLGVDIDPVRVAELNKGTIPFHEPDLEPLLQAGLRSGRLKFTTDYALAADFGDVHFICVGTPQADGSDRADLSQLYGCIDMLVPMLSRRCLIVGKCTVPPGTAADLADRLSALSLIHGVELAWCPEFVREGHAVTGFMRPDRIVAGVRSRWAEAVLREVHSWAIDAGVPFLVTDLTTAELVKIAANAFLATKISFINAMAEICEVTRGDVKLLAEALGHDPRIGSAGLRPGLGFGGGCLPKDTRAFLASAVELGKNETLSFLRDVDAINMRCRNRMVELAWNLIVEEFRLNTNSTAADRFKGVTVGILGLSYDPHSDDIRESPALDVARTIYAQGAAVTAYDPAAVERARKSYPELTYANSAREAVQDADVVLLLTDWDEFMHADPEELGKVVAHRNIADGRNALDPARWRAASWRYRTLGRSGLPNQA